MKRLVQLLSIGWLVCLQFGCAQGLPFQAVNAPVDKAVIYVYHPTYAGSGAGLAIDCDGETFGDVNNDGYIWTIVPPGRHTISSQDENKSQVVYDFAAGNSYYVEASAAGFFVRRPRLVMVPQETGKLAILSARYYGPAELYAASNTAATVHPIAAANRVAEEKPRVAPTPVRSRAIRPADQRFVDQCDQSFNEMQGLDIFQIDRDHRVARFAAETWGRMSYREKESAINRLALYFQSTQNNSQVFVRNLADDDILGGWGLSGIYIIK